MSSYDYGTGLEGLNYLEHMLEYLLSNLKTLWPLLTESSKGQFVAQLALNAGAPDPYPCHENPLIEHCHPEATLNVPEHLVAGALNPYPERCKNLMIEYLNPV